MGLPVRGLQDWSTPGGSRRVRKGEVSDLPHLLAYRLEEEGVVEILDRPKPPRRKPTPAEVPTTGPEEFAVTVEHWQTSPGWYRPPGSEKNLRRDAAIEFLRERARRGTLTPEEE